MIKKFLLSLLLVLGLGVINAQEFINENVSPDDLYSITVDLPEDVEREVRSISGIYLYGIDPQGNAHARWSGANTNTITYNNPEFYQTLYFVYVRPEDGGRTFGLVGTTFDKVPDAYCNEYEFVNLFRTWVVRNKCSNHPEPIARTLYNPDEAVADKPNIILIMTDDQGYGDTGFTGNEIIKTPVLDSLASQGVVLNRFYASAPSCAPSRASFMIGRHHERTGILNHIDGSLEFGEITLAEMASEAGYTSGVIGKWHLGTMTRDIIDGRRGGRPENDQFYGPPVLHGFDYQFTTEGSVRTWYPYQSSMRYWTGEGESVAHQDKGDSEIITDKTIEFIEDNQGGPFITLVWYHVPHTPLRTGDGITAQYEGRGFSDTQVDYFSLVTDTDKQIGRITDKLEELGLSDNTIIMYSSDNGPAPSPTGGTYNPNNHPGSTGGLRDRKGTLYEGGLRSPAFIKWPKYIKSGTTSDIPMSTTDYFQTIASIIGVDIDQYNIEHDGDNILPYLIGSESSRDTDLFFRYSKSFGEPRRKALMRGDYKIVDPNNGVWEMYNIALDPTESNDLAGDEEYSELMDNMIAAWNEKSNSIDSE